MANEVFGASLVLKDNVSAVLKKASQSSKGFRSEVEKAKREIEKLNSQKVKEKEIRLKNSAAYKAIDGISKKLEPISKKIIMLKAKEENAVSKIKNVDSHLGKIEDNKVINMTVKGAEKAVKALGKAAIIGTAAAFTTVAAAGTVAVGSAVSFQSQMQNVGTLLDGDVNGKLETMGTDLKKLSIETGVATSDLTDGLYQVVSAFGESADSTKQLEIAAKAAKAGNATTTDSVNLLSAVTKGYGDTSAEAMQKASDLAFATVKLGQTSFPELASSMGSVIPLASTLKVSQEELFGAMSTLTGVTGNTAEVSTQLRATMQSFLSPSEGMAKALKNMGYSSGAAALESESLGTILGKLKDSVKGDEIAFANLFSSVEAKNAVLALTGAQAENFASKTEQMANAAGIADQAFETQTNSVEAMVGKIKNAGSVMLTSLGQKTLPFITKALEAVTDKLPEMEAAFDRIGTHVGPVIESVANKAQELWSDWQPVVAHITESFSGLATQMQPYISQLLNSFSSIVPYIQPVITTFTDIIAAILPVAAPIFAGISSVVAQVFPVVSQIIQDVGAKFQTAFDLIGSKTGFIQTLFETAAPAISSVLTTAWSVISPILDLAIEGVNLFASVIEWAFPYIQGVIEGVWSIIQPIIEGIGNGISKVAGAVGKVADFIGGGSDSGKETPVGHNATGTSYWKGGYTEVGEHGGEIINLPSGSKVMSNSTSQAMLAGNNGINISIANMTVREEADIEKVAEALARKIDETRENM